MADPPQRLDTEPIRTFITRAGRGTADAPEHLWGFGGLHGGLILASMAAAASGTVVDPADERPLALRSLSAQFHRPIREAFALTTQRIAASGSHASAGIRAETTGDRITAATATAVFGRDRGLPGPLLAPRMPEVAAPSDCAPVDVPADFAPFARHTEIRNAGGSLPFSGGDRAELTAWVRTASDLPPDAFTLVFLTDVLAPSYAAVLTELRPVPTVELSVHLSGAHASTPWVLMRARTSSATAEGWITEDLDLWDVDGSHLATARQLRVIRTPAARRPTPDSAREDA